MCPSYETFRRKLYFINIRTGQSKKHVSLAYSIEETDISRQGCRGGHKKILCEMTKHYYFDTRLQFRRLSI